MPIFSCILWETPMPLDPNERKTKAIKLLMTDKKLSSVQIGEDTGKGEHWVRNALIPGRSQKGTNELADYLRERFKLPETWPELAEVGGLPMGKVEHIGTVGAGPGQLTDPDFDDVEVPNAWITPDMRGMTVTGDSMYPFLWDGDHILCRLAERPIPGKIMVARTPDGLVIKRVGMGAQGFELRSLAEGYPDVPARDAKILGILVGRFRRFPAPKNKVKLDFDGDGLVPDED
jgi:hypothetical protein